MSYIQAFTRAENEIALNRIEAAITAGLDSQPISFCARLLALVDDLDEDTVIVIRKVLF